MVEPCSCQQEKKSTSPILLSYLFIYSALIYELNKTNMLGASSSRGLQPDEGERYIIYLAIFDL